MRIAFIGQMGIPAKSHGIEKYVEEVFVRMAEAGNDVFVYTCGTCAAGKSKTYRGVHLVRVPKIIAKHSNLMIHNFFASIHVLFGKYDVIHYAAKEMRFLNWMAIIFLPSTLLVPIDELQCSLQKNSAFLARHSKNLRAISQWGLRDKKYILFVGQLSKRDGAHYLIEAFKQLENTAKTPNNFKLVIVGDEFQADDYATYLHTISAGRDNVIFTGAQKGAALRQLFLHAYMFVQPSESEGLSPLFLFEAMSYGLTPLVSNLKENIEAINGNGFAFTSRSVLDLRDKLAYLLNRPEKIEATGRLAQKRIRHEFSWDSFVKKIIDTYKNVILEGK